MRDKYKKFLIYFLLFAIIFGTFNLGLVTHASSNIKADNNNSKQSKTTIEIAGNATSTDAGFLPADAPEINAEAAIVMDLDTGDILYEKNAYDRKYPASITKVMTCLLAVENGNVNDELTVSDNIMAQVEEGSSSIGLQSGEKLTLKDALYGMMLNSGNECALLIAENIGGSTEGFSQMMNDRARNLGCLDSNFVNPNGLQNENHYTTCYDMALIGQAAYQYPEFKKLISSQSYTIPETNLNVERNLWQENRLIYSGNGEYYYEYCTGGKTGYTVTALATLISFAERDGKRLVCVVMKCDPTTESYLDSIKLYNFCFNSYRMSLPLIDYEFKSKNEEKDTVLSNFYSDLNHDIPKYYVNQKYSFCVRSFINDSDIEKDIEYYSSPKGNVIGMIRFKYDGEILGETEIFINTPSILATSTDAIIDKKNAPKPQYFIVKHFKQIILLFIIIILIVLIIIIIHKIRKEIQYHNSKRRIKYFPYTKDKRRQKELEKKSKNIDKELSENESVNKENSAENN